MAPPLQVPKGRAFDCMSSSLSVLTYNLLAPLYVRPLDKRTGSVQPFAAFGWADEVALSWTGRREKILSELTNCKADLICLQEVQFERIGNGFALPSWLQLSGYDARIPGQTQLANIAARNKRVLDEPAAIGNALLWRTERLKRAGAVGAQDATTCVGCCLRGAPHGPLEHFGSFLAYSVHLDAASEAKRVQQLSGCLSLAKSKNIISMVIGGDLNSEILPGSALGALLGDDPKPSEQEIMQECAAGMWISNSDETGDSSGDADDGDGDEAAQPSDKSAATAAKLQDGAELGPSAAQLEEWKQLRATAAATRSKSRVFLARCPTGATRAAWPFDRQGPPCETWRLDHILFTRRTLRPKIVWSALESDPLACRVGLPNAHCPSDHLPVGASFEFAPPTAIDEPKRADIAARLKQLEAAQVEQVNRLHKALCDEEAQLSSPVLTGKDRKKSREQPPAEVLHYLAPCLMWHSEKDHARQKQVMEFIRGKRQRQKALKLLQQSEREKFVRSLEGVDESQYVRAVFTKFASRKSCAFPGFATGEAEQDMLDDVLRATRNVQIDEWIDGHVNA